VKKYLLFFLLAVAVSIGHFGPKTWRHVTKKTAKEHKFLVSEQKPFAVVIPSYNNLKWCKKNLGSVLKQDYDNFRIIYIDDASNDGMEARIKEYLPRKDKAHRVTYIRNEKNRGAMANLYDAIHSCRDDEVVVVLDGDDWLAHDHVLSKLNESYANPDVWLTYGNYIEYPTYKKSDNCAKLIPQKIIKENAFREYRWSASHLRTFYAGLFKRIALQDFLFDGKFYESTYDLACMFPMLEMAGEHSKFVKDILCIYNRDNPLNDDKVRFEKQQALNHYIRALPRYERLLGFSKNSDEKERVDLVVFSFDRPLQLYAFLESAQEYIFGLGERVVIYRSSNPDFETGYEQVRLAFPSVRFVRQGDNPKEDFKPLMMRAVFGTPSPYVVFAVDDIIVKDDVDLTQCTAAMEKTGAYGFYLKLGQGIDYCYTMNEEQGIPESIDCGNGIYAWQFEAGKFDWHYPNTVDLTVYKKEEIRTRLSQMKFTNPNTFEAGWARKADMRKVGLYFANAKMINIPINLVNISGNRHMNSFSVQELLEKFKAGLKIDIARFHQFPNHSVHTETEIAFTERLREN